MELSIAVFLLRQSACELLPTIFDPPKRNTWNTLLTLHLCISASEPKVLKLRSGIFFAFICPEEVSRNTFPEKRYVVL